MKTARNLVLATNLTILSINLAFYLTTFRPAPGGPLGPLSREMGVLFTCLIGFGLCAVWSILLFNSKARIANHILPVLGLGLWIYTAYDVLCGEPRHHETPYRHLTLVFRNEKSLLFSIQDKRGEVYSFAGQAPSEWGLGPRDNDDPIRLRWWRGTTADRPMTLNEVFLKPAGAKRGDSIVIYVDEQDSAIVFSCAARRPLAPDKHDGRFYSEPETPGIVIVDSQFRKP